MTLYTIEIKDRLYSEWVIYQSNDETKEPSDIYVPPADQKLFNGDMFITNKNHTIELISSTVRSSIIPGVIVLKGNKTYGRHSNGKFLYKCIPDDPKIPSFLVPYEMKHMGFSKVFTNIYATMVFSEWTQKHPIGLINQVIGEVDRLENFYEYQLYCKNLNASLQKFTKNTLKSLKKHEELADYVCEKYPDIEDRTEWKVFSIDPEGSVDFDDAFSIRQIVNANGESISQLSIYIANVTLWIDALQLWQDFTNRVSTVYLPDKKRTMLPTILSDNLCSLHSKCSRFAFTMDIFISDTTNEIYEINYLNTKVKLYKNYVYEESKLLQDKDYHMLKHYVENVLSPKYHYMDNIADSHDVVQYLMIFMNYYCAKELLIHKNGIFRSVVVKSSANTSGLDKLPEDVSKFLKMIQSFSGKYIDIRKTDEPIRHDMMNMDAYIHITSPIRRLVDLLNMIQIQKNMSLVDLSPEALAFHNSWRKNIDLINEQTRSIKKVQTDCNLLHLCSTTPELLEKIHEGYAFSKKARTQEQDLDEYSVYLPELKLTTRVFTNAPIDLYEKGNYKLYLFDNEEKFKKKIRVQVV
jgi:exoribonuclease R